MIYTSYFAEICHLPDGVEPVSIALRPPKGYSGLRYPKLAPPWDILEKYKRDGNEADYIRVYRERVLSNLDPDEVVRELHSLADKQDIALVCYEKPENFCHRHIAAEWLNQHGIECLEW